MRTIYIYQNFTNNKIYVGQTSNLNKRIRDHKSKSNKNYNHPLYNSIRKYGIDNFKVTVLETVSNDEVDNAEQFWIQFFRSWDRDFGYNIEMGGCNTKTISESTKKKISEKHKGKRFNSIEHMKRLHKENGDRRRGIHLSEEVKTKISNSRKGQKHTDNAKIKMSATRIERGTFSGKNNPNFGKTGDANPAAKLTWEIVNKIRLNYSKGLKGKQLMKKYNISETNMYRILKNKIWKV